MLSAWVLQGFLPIKGYLALTLNIFIIYIYKYTHVVLHTERWVL